MQIFVLALYAAVYPALLAAVGILLASPRRLPLLTAFLLAGMTVSVCAGLGIVLLIHGSGAVAHPGSGWSWGTDLAVGLFALALGAALGTHVPQRVRARRASSKPAAVPTEEREPWSHRLLARGSLPIVVVSAVILNLPGAIYLVALKDIAAGHHSVAIDVVLVVAFNLIMFSLAEIPWVGLMVAPERTERLVRRAMTFLGLHGNKIATGLCLVVGVHLIVRAAIRS